MEISNEDIQQKLNFETAKIPWGEIQRHFARGVVLTVDRDIDLLGVAESIAGDDVETIRAWMENGLLHVATIDEARLWNDGQVELWAVVVAPWVLVQADADRE